jgi:iron complex outermembrane receptor protein
MHKHAICGEGVEVQKTSQMSSLVGATALGVGHMMVGTAGAAPDTPEAASPAGLETVVVTAQRREQDTQDVGITLSVLTGDDLKTAGLSASTEIADFTPGVHMGGSLAGQSFQFSIRGVTQNDFSDSIEAPVAVYVDDAYIPSQQGQTLAMFDIDRVEILKGPQGTLFGRNATGGLVHFIVNTPTRENTGYADISYGNLGETKFEAALGGALSDRFLARASVFYSRLDNYWENAFPAGAAEGLPLQFGPPLSKCCQDEGGFEMYAGRLQLQFDASDALTMRLVGSASSRELSTAPYTTVASTAIVNEAGSVVNVIRTPADDTRTIIGPDGNNYFNPALFPLQGAQTGIGYGPAPGLRFPGNTWFGYRPLDPEDLKLSVQYANDDSNEDSTESVGLHIDYDFGDVDLVSLTNYMHFDKMLMMDATGSPQNINQYGTQADTNAFSQEFRLSSSNGDFRWVAGLYYLNIDADVQDGLFGSTGSLFAGVFDLSLTGVDPLADRTMKTDSTSLFGQIEYDFAPGWTVIAGARGVQEKQEYDLRYYAAQNDNDYKVDTSTILFPLPYEPFSDERTQDLFAGKLQVEYRPSDGVLFFLGVNRGVKAGSYNAKIFDGSPNVSPSEIPYDPEVLLSYEGGVKWTPVDMPISINATAFHYDYSDYQAYLFTANTGVVQNVDADTDGLELQVNSRIGDNLMATFGYAWTDATIPDFAIAPDVYRDVEPTFTSEHAAALQLRYDVPREILSGRMELGGSVTYSSSFFHNLRNFDADELDGRTLANADISWFSVDDRWHVTGYIKNMTDERYATVGFDSAPNCGCSIEAYGMPRTYGVAIGTQF